MKKNELEKLFKSLEGQFDYNEPESGHQDRFLRKLNRQTGQVEQPSKEVISLHRKKPVWLRPLAMAASIALLCVVAFQLFVERPTLEEQVVEISPEITETEFYFANLVEQQVQLLKDAKSPENAKLVEDTLVQLNKLEADYKQMERDLIDGGNSKIILNAMIINFQTRIDLLKEVLTNIEEIKNLKPYDDANFTI